MPVVTVPVDPVVTAPVDIFFHTLVRIRILRSHFRRRERHLRRQSQNDNEEWKADVRVFLHIADLLLL
jgi:hypothetical protein